MPPTQIILGRDLAVAEWVRRRLADPAIAVGGESTLSPSWDWGPCTAIGVARGSELVAGIVYNNYRWPSIEATIASSTPAWCSRRNLAAIFAYPFRQLGCRRLGASTGDTNQPARAFLCRLGFRQEGLLRQALPPSLLNRAGDAVIYGMTAAECRWLPATTDAVGGESTLSPSWEEPGHVEGRGGAAGGG